MSYKRFDQEDIVISAESVTAPVWTGDTVTLNGFFTSSTQIGGVSGDYYYNLYNTGSDLDISRVQFSIGYADEKGSGSLLFNDSVPGKSPSSVLYGQYRNLVLGDEEAKFTFGTQTSEYFYVIAVDRARYKEKLLPGSLDLILNVSGSQGSIRVTDNSNLVATTTFSDSGRVYELISGSTGTVSPGAKNSDGYTNGSGSYGKFLPDIGVILINGSALDGNIEDGGLKLNTNRNNNPVSAINTRRFYDIINREPKFRLQSEETISSNFIFVRARNAEFNYSTNPSLITGSGEIRHNVMINSPQSFVTTVGLYNDNNDLLAVAKLSRPLLKDFTKEALVRIKLDY
tara:strand:+ start:17865 stop:18893 length:1029 start_codon:yes stop_codon:yes gene_type:complete